MKYKNLPVSGSIFTTVFLFTRIDPFCLAAFFAAPDVGSTRDCLTHLPLTRTSVGLAFSNSTTFSSTIGTGIFAETNTGSSPDLSCSSVAFFGLLFSVGVTASFFIGFKPSSFLSFVSWSHVGALPSCD